jgi:hypothetical protein
MKRPPRLYYKTKEEISAYRKVPVGKKLGWLEAQMEFFYHAMPDKFKRVRDRLMNGDIV